MHTNRYLRSILSILLCFICFGLQAQSLKVSLFFNGKSPFISDWISGTNSAWLTISNNGQTDRDFKVYTELFYNGEKVANTDNSKMQVVTLAAGENIKVLAEDFYSLSAVNYYGSFNVMGVAMSGKVPGGTYMFCSKLVDKTTGEELTAAQCKTFNITDYTLTLVSPFNNATLTKAEAANLNFSFVMAPKYAGIATYGLKIYELLDRQDVAQALNNVPFYEAEFKNKQSFRYPLDAPKFQEGKKYVWVVYDYNEKGTPVTQNGRSEYFVFNVGNGVLRSTITAHVTVGSIKCAGKDAEGRQVYSVTLNYQNNTGTGTPNHLGVTSVGPPYSFLPTNGIYGSIPSANATISGIAPAAASPGIAIPDGSTMPITFNISSNATSAIVQIKSCNIDADQMNRANGEDNVVLNFPPCDSCHCGTWTNDAGGAGATVHQGTNIVNVLCNKGTKGYNTCSPITITSKLVCAGKCDPSYTRMDVNGPVSYSGAIGTFNPTIQGTYMIRLTGICGKDTCVCTFDMYVDSCKKPQCHCGTWTNDAGGAGATVHQGTNTVNVLCNKGTKGYNTCSPITITSKLICEGKCDPSYTRMDVNGPVSYSGAIGTFNPTIQGTYVVRLTGICGKDTCVCTFDMYVDSCKKPQCHCGTWTNDAGGAGATVHQGTNTVNVLCNKGTKGYITCSPITVTSKLVCEGKCDPSYTHMDVNGPVSYSGAVGTFNPTIQGTYVVRLTGICGKDTCVCMFDMYVDSCKKPKCTCDSNTAWYTTPFIFNSMNYSKPATCGQTITLPAGSYNFILPTFNCKPGTCTATYPWTVNGVWQSGTGKVKTYNFVSGTYVITFAPMCGTDTCTKCTVTIVIEDSSCNCYKWLSKKVQVVSKSGTQTKACGGVFDVKVNTVVNFTFPGYQCSKTICKPTYDYSIAGGSAATGIGNKFPYTFAACGTYTVTARAYCNGHLCDSCKAIINVTGCDSCNCGTWVKMQVSQQGSSTQPVKCGGGVEGYTTCGPVFVNAFLNCVGDCKAKDVQMTVTGPLGFTPVTAVVPGSFVPTLPGSYLVTMTGKCGDIICKCDFKIYVTKCKDTICECGEWAEIKVGQEGSTVKYAKCGGTMEGYSACGPINVSALLNCKGDCKAKDLMMSVTGPVGFTPVSTSVAGSFTPNIPGVYVVSLKGKCGDNICKCQFKIIVKACCDCGEWDKDPGSITYYDGVKKVKKELHCGEKYGLAYDGYPIVVNKNYICNGKCKATYDWQLINTATNTVVTGGTDVAMPIKFVVKEPGCYKMVITAKCGGKICASCEITICTSECCTDWGKIIYNLNGSASSSLTCGGTIQADQTDVVNVAGSYTCNTTFDCKSQTTTSVYLPDGTLYSQAPGLTFTFPKPGTIPVCGLYKVVFTAKCGNQICQVCTFFINVDCCGKRHIARVDKKGEPIKESGCIQPGTYTFNLIPGLLPGTPISYQLVTKPDNATIASGTYSYSGSGMPFTIPPYLCGAKTGFELTFTWNDGKCHDVFKGAICDSPCCYFIRYMGTTNRSLSSNIYTFKTSFAVPAGIAISQVKVQLIESRDGTTPTPKANIQELIVNAVSPTGLVSQAITTPGSGIWFGTLTGIPTLLEFQGKVINEPGSLGSTHMIIRYTFYAKNGNCVAEICEQNIEYGKGK